MIINERKFLSLSIFVIFCTIFIASCTETSVEAPVAGVIMPLKAGNQWNYKAIVLDSNGQQMPNQSWEIPIRVHNDTTINGTSWLVLDNFFDKEKKDHFQYRQDGAWFEYRGNAGLFFQYPATANASYTAPDGGTTNVVSTNRSVTVPAGTFTCYEYSMVDVENPSFVIRYLLAKNVGIVKLTLQGDNLDVYVGKNGPATILYELQSYNLR